jgi:hypothetical protein
MPLAAPAEAGANLSEIVQLVVTVTQVVLSIINPRPVTVGPNTTGVPLLVTVTTLAGDVSPIETVPKFTDAGLTASDGVDEETPFP